MRTPFRPPWTGYGGDVVDLRGVERLAIRITRDTRAELPAPLIHYRLV
jgi:hypothetical protein